MKKKFLMTLKPERLPPQAADVVAGGALPRSREAPGQTSRSGRQVPSPEEVPDAQDHLGRRAEDALLQGANEVTTDVSSSRRGGLKKNELVCLMFGGKVEHLTESS